MATLRRNIFDPLYCLKNRSPLRGYWRELEQTQYLPEAALRRMQWRRLEELLRYVWDHNGFYRSRFEAAGIRPETIGSPGDLARIPVLTKEEIRRHTPEMISKGFSTGALMRFKTGGSTGKSLELYLTEECSEQRNACARRHDRWTGWEVGEPVAAVWGNPELPTGAKQWLRQWLLAPCIYLDTMNVNEGAVRAFASRWQRCRPTLLFGHAHSLYLLARELQGLKLAGLRPRGILSTSMMLLPHERATIEEVFGVQVTDRYGCEEVSLIASQCEHQGMHLNIEHLIVEFLREDGSPARAGEPGRIVVTDLMNRAMPFIRYQVEDVGVPSDRKCSCGRGLPLLEGVTGRVADFLVRKDGSRVAGVSLIENTLTRIPGIDQMQIVQEHADLLVLRVVPGGAYGAATAGALGAYFAGVFPGVEEIRIELTDRIPPETSGKYRFSICRL